MTDSRTTELREKLTELGVKWWPMRNNGYYEERDTEFVANGKKHTAHEWGDGLAVYNLTPEQTITATLGRRTCHLEETVHQREIASEFGGGYYDETTYDCDECGFENADSNIRFCGGCGAQVVSADD